MSTTTKEVHKFKKGEKVHLDTIYCIQGLGGGHWWQRLRDNEDCEDLVIVEDITITITIKRSPNTDREER